jgi:hypothetical protein
MTVDRLDKIKFHSDGCQVIRDAISAETLTPTAKTGRSKEMREPQYDGCLKVRDEIGFQRFGLMTNQVWYDDPRRLTFLLSRYKFAPKMLSGKSRVAELGRGDGIGAQLVRQVFPVIDLYDFDPIFVAEANANQVSRWNMQAFGADILKGAATSGRSGTSLCR